MIRRRIRISVWLPEFVRGLNGAKIRRVKTRRVNKISAWGEAKRNPRGQTKIDQASQELVVKSIDLRRVRPPTGSGLVGSHLRGDRFYGEVASSGRPMLTVRSEIGPYRRPVVRGFTLLLRFFCWAIALGASPFLEPLPGGEQPPAERAGSANASVAFGKAGPERRVAAETSPHANSGAFTKSFIQEGISVELSMETLQADKNANGNFCEGDDVLFRFRITDTATGSPVTGANPAAWMSRRSDDKRSPNETCAEKVQKFLSGTIFAQADLDMNIFHVLALNDDATITVVDPLFGFGGTKLLAMVALKSPGEDWVLTSDEKRLFVSMPDAKQVAVIDTSTWKVIANLDVGSRPERVALQPDQEYLWVSHDTSGNQSNDSGVTAITAAGLELVANIPTGKGTHAMAFSEDSRFAFITNRDADTVSVIDVRKLQRVKDIPVGSKPASIAFSTLSQLAYAVNEESGTIVAIDGRRQDVIARIEAEPGLGQLKFGPGGRFGVVVNPEKNALHILDSALNRIVQTCHVESGPDQIAFSDDLAYVRHRGSEIVLMIPLNEVGSEGKAVPAADFPGGQSPFGKGRRPSIADGIVQAPGSNAVLIANPADKAIYYYKEGMAAPIGSFSNHTREPRAVLAVDRSLKQRSPGVYETIGKLTRPGLYDVVFFLDNPRLAHCFEVAVNPNPEQGTQSHVESVNVEPLIKDRIVRAGEPIRLSIRLTDAATKEPMADQNDVRVLTMLAPGIWHQRQRAESVGGGVYAVDFVPPKPGIYYVYIEAQSLGLTFNNPQYIVLRAEGFAGEREK
jgi:YVTN family beta-propeller protein